MAESHLGDIGCPSCSSAIARCLRNGVARRDIGSGVGDKVIVLMLEMSSAGNGCDSSHISLEVDRDRSDENGDTPVPPVPAENSSELCRSEGGRDADRTGDGGNSNAVA